MNKLNHILIQTYKLEAVRCTLLRKKIGHVYKVETQYKTYCLKLYQNRTTKEVNDIISVMNFLSINGVSVPRIIKGANHQYYFKFENQVGMLMEYINGEPVSIKNHKGLIVDLHTQINRVVKRYSNALPVHKEAYYVGRFINHLRRLHFDEQKVIELQEIGNLLFSNIQKLDKGFCHGDFHTGNMLIKDGIIFLFDFDYFRKQAAILDLLTVFDQTNFNTYRYRDMVSNAKIIKSYITNDDLDIKNVLSFIPLRHLEIIMNIIDVNGHDSIKEDFYHQQYDWIKTYVNNLEKLS